MPSAAVSNGSAFAVDENQIQRRHADVSDANLAASKELTVKTTDQLMLAGIGLFAALAAVAAISAPLLQTAQQAAAPSAIEATAIPLYGDDALRKADTANADANAPVLQVTARVLSAEPVGIWDTLGEITLKPRSDGVVAVPVEPCWRTDRLPELPKDYRWLMKPGALICTADACVAGFAIDGQAQPVPSADQPKLIDPASASLKYERDPACISPTPAP
jgi:hypothetical protein